MNIIPEQIKHKDELSSQYNKPNGLNCRRKKKVNRILYDNVTGQTQVSNDNEYQRHLKENVRNHVQMKTTF